VGNTPTSLGDRCRGECQDASAPQSGPRASELHQADRTSQFAQPSHALDVSRGIVYTTSCDCLSIARHLFRDARAMNGRVELLSMTSPRRSDLAMQHFATGFTKSGRNSISRFVRRVKLASDNSMLLMNLRRTDRLDRRRGSVQQHAALCNARATSLQRPCDTDATPVRCGHNGP
jgi:hypothetical protein